MEDPGAGLEPVGMGLKSGINQRYSTLPQRLTTSLAKRGFANSGQLGQGFKGLELARMQELGDVDSKIAELMLSREDSAMDLATRLLTLGQGRKSTTSGNVAGGAVGAGIETLSYIDTINKLLGGGGAAAGAAGAAGTAIASGVTAADLAAGITAPAAVSSLAAPAVGTGAAAGGGTAAAGAGAGAGSSALAALPGVGLVASVPLLAKGVNAFGDWLGSKFPDWMYGQSEHGPEWDSYLYYLSNQPGNPEPTEEGFQQWLGQGGGSWLGGG